MMKSQLQKAQCDYTTIISSVNNQSPWNWAQRPGALDDLKEAFKDLDEQMKSNEFLTTMLVDDLKTLKKNYDEPTLTVQFHKIAPCIQKPLCALQKELKKTLALHQVHING